MPTIFPQNTYYHSNPNNDQPNYVIENALFPTFSCSSFYHFSNPLSLPLYNNPDDNELCQIRLYYITASLHEKQFTTIELNQTDSLHKKLTKFQFTIMITPLHDPMKSPFQMTIITLTPN